MRRALRDVISGSGDWGFSRQTPEHPGAVQKVLGGSPPCFQDAPESIHPPTFSNLRATPCSVR